MQNTEFNRLKLLLDTLYFPLSGGRINGKTIFTKLVSFCSADKKKVVSIQNGMIEGANVSYFGICDAEQGAKQFKSVKIQGVEGFALRVGTSIAVKFATTNSFPATQAAPIALDVNGTGVKNIYYDTGIPTGTDVIAFGKANTSNVYMYDGTYWVFVGSGSSEKEHSHVGQIIHSTTLNTEAKVKAIYGSNTTWIQHTGYVLRGADSGVVADQAQNDGGADSVTVSSVASHNHTQNAHSHSSRASWHNGSQQGGTLYGLAWATNSNVMVDTGGNLASGWQSGVSVLNATATNKANGANYTVNTLPKYKNVYIWERTA